MKKKIIVILRKGFLLLSKTLTDILLLLGGFFTTYGVMKIYLPAGYITLGVCFLAFAFLIAKKRGS